MWTRKELKDKAKVSFRANYWKTVFVALIVIAISVWASGASSSSIAMPTTGTTSAVTTYSPDDVNVSIDDGQITVDTGDENGGTVHVSLDAEDAEALEEVIEDIADDGATFHGIDMTGPGLIMVGLSIGMILLVIIAIGMAVYAFVFNPLEVGCQRFFIRNLNQRAEVKEVAFAYDNNYLESVKTLFLRDIFILLWSLLLIIPGIYKSYEYRMIPYLMADDPTMTKDRAFAESKRMMDGNKWNAFVLDLSFLGWNILSALTLGILGVFYVNPYQAQTNAALYERLRYGLPAPDQVAQPAQPWPTAPYGSAPAQSVQPGQTVPLSPYANAYQQPAPAAPVATAPIAVAPVAMAAPEQVVPSQAAPAQAAPAQAAPIADTQGMAAPVIAPASQPPIPPFAAVGYEPVDDDEELLEDGFEAQAAPEAEAVADEAPAPVAQNGEGDSAEPEPSDSPEA